MSTQTHSFEKLYIALFGSIIFHGVVVISLFHNFPKLELDRKTVPFQLISNTRQGNNSSSSLSKSENTLAAQEFLRTLNEANFEQLIKHNTQKGQQLRDKTSPFKSESDITFETFEQPTPFRNNFPSNTFKGLQDLFSPTKKTNKQTADIEQIQTKEKAFLSNYELSLLKKLTEGRLYDAFHPEMQKYQQDSINLELTLHLLSNGAIRNAVISESSSILEIDNLAIKAAYSASPYPIPPKEDAKRGFKYTIPMKYIKQ